MFDWNQERTSFKALNPLRNTRGRGIQNLSHSPSVRMAVNPRPPNSACGSAPQSPWAVTPSPFSAHLPGLACSRSPHAGLSTLGPSQSRPSPRRPLSASLSHHWGPRPLGWALTSSCRAPPDGATRRPGRARSSGSAVRSQERPS